MTMPQQTAKERTKTMNGVVIAIKLPGIFKNTDSV